MGANGSTQVSARFDRFHVDLSSGELLRSGERVPIQEKPLQVLRLLLEAEGNVVTREQLRSALWPADTFVDFEHGVNTAVKKLRQALEDSADNPRFVETLPKFGYRFISPVEWLTNGYHAHPIGAQTLPTAAVAVPSSVASEQIPKPAGWPWRFASLAFLLLLLAGVGVLWVRSRPHPQPSQLTIVPFTTFPGFEIAPSFSPDGHQVVFSWFGYEKEFQFDLYVKQVGQERVVQLTHHPAKFLASAWSPDGRLIAFMREAEPDASGIYLISPLGGPERKLADTTPLVGWSPIAVTWSADSTWVAFAKASSPQDTRNSSPGHFAIHLVNVDTAEERVLPKPSPECLDAWQPAFSPDGKYLASVCVLNEGLANIYVQSSDGKQSREVTGAKSLEGFAGVAWAKNSQSLLYASDHHLWRVPLEGGKPEKLLFAQDVESVAVASAGNRLVFAQVRHPNSVWQLQLPNESAPAGSASKLISSSRGDFFPRTSPDGKFIVFESMRSGNPEIWVTDRDASNPIQLTFFGGPQIGPPSWSPDSRRLVFDLRASRNAELFTVSVEGGPPRRFPTATTNASNPVWSADGKWIYFNTEGPDAIWKVPAEGGAAVRLTEAKGETAPQESMDHARVFFSKAEGDHGHAWSVSVNGGDEHSIPGMPADVSWVVTKSGAYFIDGSPRHYSLNHFDFLSQKVHKVSDLAPLFYPGGSQPFVRRSNLALRWN